MHIVTEKNPKQAKPATVVESDGERKGGRGEKKTCQ